MQEELFNSERAAGERSMELISLAACASSKWRAWLQSIYSTTDKLVKRSRQCLSKGERNDMFQVIRASQRTSPVQDKAGKSFVPHLIQGHDCWHWPATCRSSGDQHYSYRTNSATVQWESDELKEYLSPLSKAYLVVRDIHTSSIGL